MGTRQSGLGSPKADLLVPALALVGSELATSQRDVFSRAPLPTSTPVRAERGHDPSRSCSRKALTSESDKRAQCGWAAIEIGVEDWRIRVSVVARGR